MEFPVTLTSCLIIPVLSNLGFSSVLIISSNSLSSSFNCCCSSFVKLSFNIVSSFLIFFRGLSNKRFTICVAGFLYLFFILLQLIGIFIWIFCRLILIVSFSKLISALTFFNHFIPIKTFSSFDSITCNLIGNFFSWISKLSLTFLKAIMSFLFADVKILLLGSSIWVFNFSNKVFVIIFQSGNIPNKETHFRMIYRKSLKFDWLLHAY